MIVICLEGCHGCGKTEMCRRFEKAGYDCLDEAFMDMPALDLHPQSLVMESIWVSRWMERLLTKKAELGEKEKSTIFFADRSPYSAVFYSKTNGHVLDPLIKAQLQALREEAGIFVYTVYLRVASDNLLWERIQTRLVKEPQRKLYNEHSRQWMQTTLQFYESRTWDFVFENNRSSLDDLSLSLSNHLTDRVSDFVNRFELSSQHPIVV